MINNVSIVPREVYHARRWLEDPRFQSHTAALPDGSTVFVSDFVYLIHPLHGHVLGKLQQFFQKVNILHNVQYIGSDGMLLLPLQEGAVDIFASADILLDPHQFCSALQRPLLPSAPGTMILFETCEVPVSTILCVSEAIPTTLVTWCPSANVCRNVMQEVFFVCMCVEFTCWHTCVCEID